MKKIFFAIASIAFCLSFYSTAANASGPIQKTFKCEPYNKSGTKIGQITINSKATYEDVFKKGEQEVWGFAKSVKIGPQKRNFEKFSFLDIKGVAANSAKGVYFSLYAVDQGYIKEIIIAAPASGKGASAIILHNDKLYPMDCREEKSLR